MPKIKKEANSKKIPKNLFYYEIIGIILTIFSFFALARLGKFGFYLCLILKLLFGDWYFLFIFLGIIVGLYFLLKHQKLPITSLSFLGYLLIFISLTVLSHFSMHDYVIQYSESYFSTTASLYFDYFKTGALTSIVGGGLIGMVLFYLFYYLLAKPGIIIICIGMILTWICFLSKKTFIDYVNFFKNGFQKLLVFIRNRVKKLKTNVEKINNEYNSSNNKKKLPKQLICEEVTNTFKYENEVIVEELVTKIKKALNNLCLFHYEVSKMITPNLYVFKIKSFLKINITSLENELKTTLNIPFLIKMDMITNDIFIEVNNYNLYQLSLYDLKEYFKTDAIVLSVDDRNNPVYLEKENNRVLIFSKDLNFFINYLFQSLFNKNTCVTLVDFSLKLGKFEAYVDTFYNDFSYIDELIKTLEDEKTTYNNQMAIFINISSNVSNLQSYLQKIRYIMEITKEKNFLFVVQIEKFIDTDSYFYDSFNYLIDASIEDREVLSLFGFSSPLGLMLGKEALLKNDDLVVRIASIIVKEKEVSKL